MGGILRRNDVLSNDKFVRESYGVLCGVHQQSRSGKYPHGESHNAFCFQGGKSQACAHNDDCNYPMKSGCLHVPLIDGKSEK